MVYELVSGEKMFQTLAVEVPLVEGQSTMATRTRVREHIEISTVERPVYKSVSSAGTFKTLEVGGKSSP